MEYVQKRDNDTSTDWLDYLSIIDTSAATDFVSAANDTAGFEKYRLALHCEA